MLVAVADVVPVEDPPAEPVDVVDVVDVTPLVVVVAATPAPRMLASTAWYSLMRDATSLCALAGTGTHTSQ